MTPLPPPQMGQMGDAILGTIFMTATGFCPTGSLPCDGSPVSNQALATLVGEFLFVVLREEQHYHLHPPPFYVSLCREHTARLAREIPPGCWVWPGPDAAQRS